MNQDPLVDELTIEEAADVLNVTPAFVADLIEGGPFRVRSGGVDLLAPRMSSRIGIESTPSPERPSTQ